MPNLVGVLKEEITRLARKEVKAATTKQQKQLQGLRANVKSLRDEIASLKKALSRMTVEMKRLESTAPDEEERDIRISPASIKKHRQRLGLSQAKMARLLEISTNTVVLWESGKTAPRGDNRVAVAELRKMGVRDVKALLNVE